MCFRPPELLKNTTLLNLFNNLVAFMRIPHDWKDPTTPSQNSRLKNIVSFILKKIKSSDGSRRRNVGLVLLYVQFAQLSPE